MTDWWDDGPTGIESGLEMHALWTGFSESHPFAQVQARVLSRDPQCLDNADLAVVAQFKVWRGLRGRVEKRALAAKGVESATEEALGLARTGSVSAAMRVLCKLPGVGVPTASALLTAAYPSDFGIIDRLCLAEVTLLSANRVAQPGAADPALSDLVMAAGFWIGGSWIEAYTAYVAGLASRGSPLGFTVREVERALFGHALERRGQGTR